MTIEGPEELSGSKFVVSVGELQLAFSSEAKAGEWLTVLRLYVAQSSGLAKSTPPAATIPSSAAARTAAQDKSEKDRNKRSSLGAFMSKKPLKYASRSSMLPFYWFFFRIAFT